MWQRKWTVSTNGSKIESLIVVLNVPKVTCSRKETKPKTSSFKKLFVFENLKALKIFVCVYTMYNKIKKKSCPFEYIYILVFSN